MTSTLSGYRQTKQGTCYHHYWLLLVTIEKQAVNSTHMHDILCNIDTASTPARFTILMATSVRWILCDDTKFQYILPLWVLGGKKSQLGATGDLFCNNRSCCWARRKNGGIVVFTSDLGRNWASGIMGRVWDVSITLRQFLRQEVSACMSSRGSNLVMLFVVAFRFIPIFLTRYLFVARTHFLLSTVA